MENYNKMESILKEIYSHKNEFGINIFAYQKFIQDNFNVFISLSFDENYDIVFSLNTEAIKKLSE